MSFLRLWVTVFCFLLGVTAVVGLCVAAVGALIALFTAIALPLWAKLAGAFVLALLGASFLLALWLRK